MGKKQKLTCGKCGREEEGDEEKLINSGWTWGNLVVKKNRKEHKIEYVCCEDCDYNFDECSEKHFENRGE